eukprot:CAMPEP_0204318202 /NCGR_PEP_ID=MMETSP0469-20131031/6400_1 /ASSEMBLY_ACC=CAM_ASM_000384 /TAXON_ID=2969 /ORGANISM="Oxyrrhis marina" /LENGTH=843 /DNA_ID=CAMNT_0051299231 /DNA_START=38 /DNA_END=2569 /DNA_ORIENTATION=-
MAFSPRVEAVPGAVRVHPAGSIKGAVPMRPGGGPPTLLCGVGPPANVVKPSRPFWARVVGVAAPIIRSKGFQGTSLVLLFVALFLSDAAGCFGFPDDPWNSIQDGMMTLIMAFFTLEMLLTYIVDNTTYNVTSFFLWMDVLGTISMVFEISFMLGDGGEIKTTSSDSASSSAVLLRAARAARLGARAGRITKMFKFLPGFGNDSKEAAPEAEISRLLQAKLSARVAALTILLVVALPMIGLVLPQYPEVDRSMAAWVDSMDLAAKSGADAAVTRAGDMSAFYAKHNGHYFPFRVEPVAASLTGDLQGWGEYSTPSRLADVLLVSGDNYAVYFDFSVMNQFESGYNLTVTFLVVLVMVLFSFNLSAVLSGLVVSPLERMLTVMRAVTETIYGTMSVLGDDETVAAGPGSAAPGGKSKLSVLSEVDQLEAVMAKLAKMSKLMVNKPAVGEQELKDMGDEGQGVLAMVDQTLQRREPRARSEVCVAEGLRFTEGKLSVATDVLESWELDVLTLSLMEQKMVAVWALLDSSLGQRVGRQHTDADTLVRFMDAVEPQYHDNSYHNFAHGVDVCHTVSRILSAIHAERWLGSVECMAVMIAAICHDVGHPGQTNPFLVETQHELALLYNDKSPLENMHCAVLFKICGKAPTDVFHRLSVEERKAARKVAVETILHTDMAHHFAMVKDLGLMFEMFGADRPANMTAVEVADYFGTTLQPQDNLMILQMALHTADVSNPLKPFDICHAWADRVLAEFFQQGDKEKELGIPVGFLNDRLKVKKPSSQIGFIEILVAPLVSNAVNLFPSLGDRGSQLLSNVESWAQLWSEETSPDAEDQGKMKARIEKMKGMF